jgi:hypothetical protein
VLRRVEKLIRRRLATAEPPDVFAHGARPSTPVPASSGGEAPSAPRSYAKGGGNSSHFPRGGNHEPRARGNANNGPSSSRGRETNERNSYEPARRDGAPAPRPQSGIRYPASNEGARAKGAPRVDSGRDGRSSGAERPGQGYGNRRFRGPASTRTSRG